MQNNKRPMELYRKNIYAKCRLLSSFEGGRLTDGQGESMYAQVHMTDQDTPLIDGLTDKGAEWLNGRFSSTLGGVSLNDAVPGETRGAQKMAEEIVAARVMAGWLEDKSKERSESYARMADQMALALRTMLKPTLMEDY